MALNNRHRKNGIWFRLYGPIPLVPCHWCGKPLMFNEATLDHEPPKTIVGHSYGAAVISCLKCNVGRGIALLEELTKRGLR